MKSKKQKGIQKTERKPKNRKKSKRGISNSVTTFLATF
jgi:hypothetical protein